MRLKEFYRERIIGMVNQISRTSILKIIYGVTLSGYKEEKAGK